MIPFIAQRPEHRILKQLEFHFASICIILLPIQMFELDRAQKPHFLQSTRNIFTFSFIQTTNWTLSIYIFPFTKYFWSHSFFLPKNCYCANRTLLSHQRTGRRKESERGQMMKRGRTIKYRLFVHSIFWQLTIVVIVNVGMNWLYSFHGGFAKSNSSLFISAFLLLKFDFYSSLFIV